MFASTRGLRNQHLLFIDDIESLCYVGYYFLFKDLPWQHETLNRWAQEIKISSIDYQIHRIRMTFKY